ncbi:hypothetical protein QQS21_000306 [Conoideocrella luteorostrata]|uniref:Uncharacterized protein n=1 Tax=Conoideocrella luteorostrata TaxID=1105319 RepID=A0AAJ0D1T6_9HYPO|nr:hypothetical protein QQS21_000306 [Conoideocrella luteorostrata]
MNQMAFHRSRKLLLGAVVGFILLLPTTSAASPTNTTDPTCSKEKFSSIQTAPWNSTGTMEFSFGQAGNVDPGKWYLTMTLLDTPYYRAEKSDWTHGNYIQKFQIYLSLPASWVESDSGNETNLCMYFMQGFNKSAAATGANPCNGVLSDKCITAMWNAATKFGRRDVCPSLGDSDAPSNCNDLTPNRVMEQNFPGHKCAVGSLPGVEIPRSHQTFQVTGLETQRGGLEFAKDSYKAYDLAVRQPVPILMTAQIGGQRQAAILCPSPNHTVKGSRHPEGEFPPSAGSGLAVSRAVALAAAAAFIIASSVI